MGLETLVREVLIDVIARELGLDAVEVRRRNLVRPTSSRARWRPARRSTA